MHVRGTNWGHGNRTGVRLLLARTASLLLLSLLLVSCLDQRAPRLELSSSEELLMSSTDSSIVVRNAGGRLLDWSVTVDDPRVLLTPAGGRLFAFGTSTVTIRIETGTVDKNDLFTATLSFRSNGGDKQMLLRFTPESGIGRCADHLPYELPFATGAIARTAVPGIGAVPVEGEILVGYRADARDRPLEPFSAPPDGTRPQPYAGLEVGPRPLSGKARLRASLQAELGLSLVRAGVSGSPDLYRSAAPVAPLLAELLADPRVAYAQRNYYLELAALPDDPDLATMQWNLMEFGLPAAWEVYDGHSAARDVVLAVVDSGIYGAHPDLTDKLLPGWDFHGRDPDTNPGVPTADNDAAHGTHVAGIAAASGNNGIGIAGVAYGSAVKIVPVKVFDDVGAGGSIAGLVDAIRWAAGLPSDGVPPNAHPAAVINMSLGVAGRHPALEAAALDAWNAGSLLVAAAGNHNAAVPDRGVLSPANAPCVIAVGSVDSDRQVSGFSNHGPELELLAPGGFAGVGCGRVYSTVPPTPGENGEPDEIYGCLAGTSMASPIVAGVAALLIGQGDFTSPPEVRRRLSETALPPAPHSDLQYHGNGLICADAALGTPSQCGLPPELSEAAELR